MNLQIDTNIILDVLLISQPFYEYSSGIIALAQKNNYNIYIVASGVTDIYYVIRKQIAKGKALVEVKNILQSFQISDVNKKILIQATNNNFDDFEDAVQHETAIHSNIDFIITRNNKDYKHSKIKVLTPKEFIKQFS